MVETLMEWLPAASLGWWLLATALILVGVAGTVLPALPGVVLVYAGILLGAWIDDFSRVGAWPLALIGLLAALAWVTDYAAAALGARKVGASGWALAGAALGTVLGVLTGLVGLLFLPLLGAMAGEALARRHELTRDGASLAPAGSGHQVVRVGLATWLGMLVGTAVKLALVLTMVGGFILALVW
jgi:uncharacterized protein YqgC (DUF456 family)